VSKGYSGCFFAADGAGNRSERFWLGEKKQALNESGLGFLLAPGVKDRDASWNVVVNPA